MEVLVKIIGAAWFLSLLGFANMAPVFVMRAPILAYPVDLGRTFRNKRIFGDNKTWRGVFAAVFFGTGFFVLQKALYVRFAFIHGIGLFDYSSAPILYGIAVSAGAIFGDLVKSFLKRRVGIAPGASWIPFDQIDYVVGALMFGAWLYIPHSVDALLILGFGFMFHLLFKYIGYILHINAKPI